MFFPCRSGSRRVCRLRAPCRVSAAPSLPAENRLIPTELRKEALALQGSLEFDDAGGEGNLPGRPGPPLSLHASPLAPPPASPRHPRKGSSARPPELSPSSPRGSAPTAPWERVLSAAGSTGTRRTCRDPACSLLRSVNCPLAGT